MKRIKLTQGKYALVDNGDYKKLTRWRWKVLKSQQGIIYACRNVRVGEGYKTELMHRAVMNPPEHLFVDHINHDSLDNRKSNLRICSHPQNIHNSGPRGGKSKYKGVSWHKQSGKWMASIGAFGKRKHLIVSKSEVEAARAYDAAALELHGEFAYLNFPLK